MARSLPQLCGTALLELLLVSANASAGPDEVLGSSPPECEREVSVLARSACTLAGALTGLAPEAIVVARDDASSGRVSLPAATTERFARLLAARLGSGVRVGRPARSASDAWHETLPSRGLIYLTFSLHRDRFSASGDVYLTGGHFWQRLRSPGIRLIGHAISENLLDSELRALFPPIPLVVTQIDKGSLSDPPIVALACGDVRGDGSNEIAAVGRRRIRVGRLEHGHFAERAGIDWAGVSAVATSPLQEPIGACSLLLPGRLAVGLSDRADMLELSGALAVEHAWHGWMPWPDGGCTRRMGLGYAGAFSTCSAVPTTPATDFGVIVDAFASRSLADRSGQSHSLRVARPLGSETARAIDSIQSEVAVPSVGSALAVDDLDGDGLAEIISSSPERDRAADHLLVRTLSDSGQLRERLRVPVPTGIDALAVCPGDGRAMAPIVLASGSEIWVIR